MKKTYCTYINQRKARVPKLLSEKVGFRAKKIITRDRKGLYITQKGSIHRDNIEILNIHVYSQYNIGVTYVKQRLIELKRKIVKFTIVVVDSNMPPKQLIQLDKKSARI